MDFEQKSQFKETEIGNLPNDWNLITLKEACSKIGSGITPRGGANVYTSEGTALIRSQNVLNNSFSCDGLVCLKEDMAEEMENVTVEKRDVLLNITGDSVARCCTVPNNILPARVNQHVTIVRTNGKELDSIFLKYYLTSPKMQNKMLSLAQSGGTRNALTKGMIENFIIPTPHMNEQKAIAHVLSILDSKIELNLEMNKTLEAVGQAVFKRWFVDFEFPNEEGKPYKLSGGEMVYNKEMATEIPLRWQSLEIGALAEVKGRIGWRGYTIEDLTDDGPWVLGGRDLVNNFIDLSKAQHISTKKFYESPEIILKKGDIILAKTGTIGPMALFDEKIGKTTINPNVGIIRSKKIEPVFLFFFLKSNTAQRYLREFITSSVQPAINQSTIKKLVIPLPEDTEIQEMIDSLLDSIYSKQVQLMHENDVLKNIRDVILPKLMSGKIRVPSYVKMERE